MADGPASPGTYDALLSNWRAYLNRGTPNNADPWSGQSAAAPAVPLAAPFALTMPSDLSAPYLARGAADALSSPNVAAAAAPPAVASGGLLGNALAASSAGWLSSLARPQGNLGGIGGSPPLGAGSAIGQDFFAASRGVPFANSFGLPYGVAASTPYSFGLGLPSPFGSLPSGPNSSALRGPPDATRSNWMPAFNAFPTSPPAASTSLPDRNSAPGIAPVGTGTQPILSDATADPVRAGQRYAADDLEKANTIIPQFGKMRIPTELPQTGLIDPNKIEGIQNNLSGEVFADKTTSVQDTIQQLKNGLDPKKIPPVRIFEMDGQLYTLDHRRVYAAKQAGVMVNYKLATPAEILQNVMRGKFTRTPGAKVIIRGGGGDEE